MDTSPNTSPSGRRRDTLAVLAANLRSLHIAGRPLVLVNVWDAESARRAVAAGASAVATTSAAIAASYGVADDNSMPSDLAFGAVGRVAAVVDVPVTADLEAGYGLDGSALVDALLGAGAVGCNLEDSDHRRPGELVAVATAADRIAAVRAAADSTGVPIVINARIDTFVRAAGRPPETLVAAALDRARAYLSAGADCVYPIGVGDPALTRRLVDGLPAGTPVNVGLGPGVTVDQMAAVGVSRVSFGPRCYFAAMADFEERARLLFGTGG